MATKQSREALRLGHRIRCERAKLKQEIKDGERTVASVLMTIPEEVRRMKIIDLLCVQNRVGLHRAKCALTKIHVADWHWVEELTLRQRNKLAEIVSDWEPK